MARKHFVGLISIFAVLIAISFQNCGEFASPINLDLGSNGGNNNNGAAFNFQSLMDFNTVVAGAHVVSPSAGAIKWFEFPDHLVVYNVEEDQSTDTPRAAILTIFSSQQVVSSPNFTGFRRLVLPNTMFAPNDNPDYRLCVVKDFINPNLMHVFDTTNNRLYTLNPSTATLGNPFTTNVPLNLSSHFNTNKGKHFCDNMMVSGNKVVIGDLVGTGPDMELKLIEFDAAGSLTVSRAISASAVYLSAEFSEAIIEGPASSAGTMGNLVLYDLTSNFANVAGITIASNVPVRSSQSNLMAFSGSHVARSFTDSSGTETVEVYQRQSGSAYTRLVVSGIDFANETPVSMALADDHLIFVRSLDATGRKTTYFYSIVGTPALVNSLNNGTFKGFVDGAIGDKRFAVIGGPGGLSVVDLPSLTSTFSSANLATVMSKPYLAEGPVAILGPSVFAGGIQMMPTNYYAQNFAGSAVAIICASPGINCFRVLEAYPFAFTNAGLFAPKYPLWSDDTDKDRYVYLPPGSKIDNNDVDNWIYPAGTTMWKVFGYRSGSNYTKYEVRRNAKFLSGNGAPAWLRDVWVASYAGTVETLTRRVATDTDNSQMRQVSNIKLSTPYNIPHTGMCTTCHSTSADFSLGFTALQLSGVSGNFSLQGLTQRGYLVKPMTQPFEINGSPADKAALGYLHTNCGTCHSPTSSFFNAGPAAGLNFKHVSTATSLQTEPGYAIPISLNKITRGDGPNSRIILRLNGSPSFMPSRTFSPNLVQDTVATTMLSNWINGL